MDGILLRRGTSLTYNPPAYEFVEAPLFTRLVLHYLSDDEYAELQSHLNAHPEAGSVVPGSGGVRKVRWGTSGKGKRGGVRVIYYLRSKRGQIWMLTIYPKNVREDVPAQALKQMKEVIDAEEKD